MWLGTLLALANPKSANFNSPISLINKFCGFTSLWSTRRLWQYDRPRSNWNRNNRTFRWSKPPACRSMYCDKSVFYSNKLGQPINSIFTIKNPNAAESATTHHIFEYECQRFTGVNNIMQRYDIRVFQFFQQRCFTNRCKWCTLLFLQSNFLKCNYLIRQTISIQMKMEKKNKLLKTNSDREKMNDNLTTVQLWFSWTGNFQLEEPILRISIAEFHSSDVTINNYKLNKNINCVIRTT